nr:unnamed protein product [Spirometra erinaceieuropaei]
MSVLRPESPTAPTASFSTRLSTATVHGLFLEEDGVLNTAIEADTQRDINCFDSGCAQFGVTIQMGKTVVMYQPPPNAAYNVHRLHVNGTKMKTVDSFAHVGSTLPRFIKVGDEVARPITNASQAFARLQNPVWNRHGLQRNTNLKKYKVVILMTLLI